VSVLTRTAALFLVLFVFAPFKVYPEVVQRTLPNGLQVLMAEDHKSPLAVFQIWYRVGSMDESFGKTGLSHVLEHMMFKGTKKYGSKEFSRTIQRYGGTDNAFTSMDSTVYFQILPSEHLDLSLKFESDRMANLLLREEDFQAERAVVMEERRLRLEDDPQSSLYEETEAAAFRVHPYHWPVIGWMPDLAHLKLEDLKQYYRTHYTPNNAFIVVVGDIDPDALFKEIEKYFGSIKPSPPPEDRISQEPPLDGERRVYLDREAELPYVVAAYHVPTLLDEDGYALVVPLPRLRAEGRPERLCRLRGPAPRPLSFHHRGHRRPRCLRRGPGEGPLRRGGAPEGGAGIGFRACQGQEPDRGGLHHAAGFHILPGHDHRQVPSPQGLAAQGPVRGKHTGGHGGGRSPGRPEIFRPRQAHRGHSHTRGAPGAGGRQGEGGTVKRGSGRVAFLVFLVVLGLSSPARADMLDVKRSVLANGLTVLHVERHTLPLVEVVLLVKSGVVQEPAEKAGLANLTAALLTEGTESRTATEISEQLAFIGAQLDVEASYDFTRASLSVLRKDVRRGFEILSDVLLHPTFPDEEVARKISLIGGSLQQSEEQPGFLVMRAFRSRVYGKNPYGRLVRGSRETLGDITRKDVRDFYSTWYRPDNAILVVVGDLDREELGKLVDTYLDGWQRAPLPPPVREPMPPEERKVVLIDRDLAQANIAVGHKAVRRIDPDYYALRVMNYVLGGGGFASRLMETIRDRMGLAYSVYSSLAAYKDDGHFVVQVQTKNSSAGTVIEEIVRQIEAMKDKGITGEELEEAKAYLIGSFPRRIDTMGKMARFLSLVEFYGLGLDYPDRYKELIGSVTLDDVRAAARKYLHPAEAVFVVVARQSEAKVSPEAIEKAP
jgi:zinc protease